MNQEKRLEGERAERSVTQSYGSYGRSRIPLFLCNIPSDKAGVMRLARLGTAFV